VHHRKVVFCLLPFLLDVSRGYGSPPPSLLSQDRFDPFPTDSQILETVKRTKNSWNRTKSAPLYSNELQPFCGLRAELDVDLQKGDNDDDPTRFVNTLDKVQESSSIQDDQGGIGIGDLKRNRDEIFGEWAEENEENKASPGMDLDSPKRIAALPQRGSSSPFGRNRNNAQAANTLPISSGLSSYLASAQDSQWTAHDFSSFTNKHDF
jgi:hypothetical protein